MYYALQLSDVDFTETMQKVHEEYTAESGAKEALLESRTR